MVNTTTLSSCKFVTCMILLYHDMETRHSVKKKKHTGENGYMTLCSVKENTKT